MKIAGRTLKEWKEFARRDDCLDRMVPSDLREILGKIPDTANPAFIPTALDRFERACLAYERLCNMKRDDEKTRQIRKDALKEYGVARAELFYSMNAPLMESDAVVEERKRCSKIARYHTHHALWSGLPNAYSDLSESFGIALAQRIEQAILEEPLKTGTCHTSKIPAGSITATIGMFIPRELPADPGPNYDAGLYSRRNWEAAMEDLYREKDTNQGGEGNS